MTTADFPAPAEWSERIAAYLDGELAPEPARLAATVVLLRDAGAGPTDVYLVKRATTMAFAAGRYAFPGGRADPADADPALADAWAGPSPDEWAARFGCGLSDARALVCAAVRETFEETGVLFAGPSESSLVASTSGADWEADRRALESRESSLAELLARRSLVLRTDLLGAWSRWVTPEFEPRRYDTAFFVAALPPGQSAREVSGETEGTVWTPPAAAIADFHAGRASMLPPTLTTLQEVSAFGTAASALEAASTRPLEPIMADVARRADGSFALIWPS